MNLFFSDLDNTLLYSHNRSICEDKLVVEHLDGREQSFMTEFTYDFFSSAMWLQIIPVSTRTEKQYRRIECAEQLRFKYAIICNGGKLLIDGIEDNEWTKETHDLAGDNCENVKDATMYLSKLCKNETVHTPEAYMSYVKCDNPENVYKELIRWADLSKVNIQKDGRKVYVFAKRINKGTAIERFMNLSEPGTIDTIIAAGDNLMDVPMMNKANYAYARPDIYDIVTCHNKIKIEDEVFSDGICRSLEKMRMEGTF